MSTTWNSSPSKNDRMQTVNRWLKVFVVAVMAAVLYTALNQGHPVEAPVERFPDFELRTLTGDTFSSESLEGQVTILNFFATWCGPCKAEMPMLDRLAPVFQAQGARVVAVAAGGEDRLTIRAFADRYHLRFPVVLDGGNLLDVLQTGALPTTAIVDRHGVIRKVFVGMLDEKALKAAVEEALGDPRG